MYRALLLVAGWIGRSAAHHLSVLRRPLAREVVALHERIEKLRVENDLLRERLLQMEPHRRPQFKPWQRLRILWHRARYGLSLEATARAFVLSRQTVLNWLTHVERGGDRMVHAKKPTNSLPDLVGEIVHHLRREWPRWGTRRIAGILARLGVQASRSSVQRALKRPRPKRPRRPRRGRTKPVRASRPGQVYVVDFTRLGGFFRSIAVGVVIDSFSRRVIALRAWAKEPSALGTCRLVRETIAKSGKPGWIVCDRGPQFRSHRFRSFLKRHRIGKRHAAVGDRNLSRLDRFWRSMKIEYGRGLFLFRPIRTLSRKLAGYALWYNSERAHQGLGFKTPEDVARRKRKRRSRHLEGAALEVACLRGDHRLPVFRLRRAA